MDMHLDGIELNHAMTVYDCKSFVHDDHFQVEPDVWVYLFHDINDKKHILISADYLGDYEHDHFPALLRFNNFEFRQVDFILQNEIPAKDKSKAISTILFEYTD